MSIVPIPADVNITTLHPRVVDLFEKPQYEQRTPAWYEVRKTLMTASESSSALKIKPFAGFKGCPREDLMMKKLNVIPVVGMALQHGVKHEAEAAEMAMRILGERMFDFGLVVHDDYPWLGASPDGITARGYCVEIKCPMRRTIIPGHVPHHYYPQVQVQMEVCNVDFCYFIQYKPAFMNEGGHPFIDIVVVERDRMWFNERKDILLEFYTDLMERKKTHVTVTEVASILDEVDETMYGKDRDPYVREFGDHVEIVPCVVSDDLYTA